MKPAHFEACRKLQSHFGIELEPISGHPGSYSDAPAGYACDFYSKTIMVPSHVDWLNAVDKCGPEYGFEVMHHEAMHMIMQPPFATINEMPEHWVLMQVELAYAKAIADDEAVRLVKAWQRQTLGVGSEWGNGEAEDYPRRWWWRAGFALARKMGALDQRNRPTWKLPDWSKLNDWDRESWHLLVEWDDSPCFD